MTPSIQKMFSISSQQPGGARLNIRPEQLSCGSDRKIRKMTVKASLYPGTRLEVKFLGEHVVGSPFVNQPSPAALNLSDSVDEAETNNGPGRAELLRDLERAVAHAENNLLPPTEEAGMKAVNKNDPLTITTSQVDSSDSSEPASAPRIVFLAGTRWSKVGYIDRRELDGPLGVCLLKNGDLVVSTMNQQVKIFNSRLKFKKPILGGESQGLYKPGDMTLLHNGEFAIKVCPILFRILIIVCTLHHPRLLFRT